MKVMPAGFAAKQFAWEWEVTKHPATVSDQLHVIERYGRVDGSTLWVDLTIDDSKTYTKSWDVSYIYNLKTWEIGEEICTLSSEKNFDQGIVNPASAPPPK